MRYGFIGLGNLGAFLAGSLLREGFDLTVNDLHKEAAADLVAMGAAWADTPAAVAAACDAVFTCLPSPAAVDAVVAGSNGILEGAGPGLVWIDMSTSDRHDVERLVKLAQDRGVSMLEAPVTGGVVRYPHVEWAYANGYSKKYASAGWASYERPFTVWAEQAGYAVDVIAQHDLQFRPELLDGYACAVCVVGQYNWGAR